MREEPLRDDQVQIVLRARHRDVKGDDALPRFLQECPSRDQTADSRRRCLEETLISTPAPSPNEWSKGLNSPKPGQRRGGRAKSAGGGGSGRADQRGCDF